MLIYEPSFRVQGNDVVFQSTRRFADSSGVLLHNLSDHILGGVTECAAKGGEMQHHPEKLPVGRRLGSPELVYGRHIAKLRSKFEDFSFFWRRLTR